MTSKARELRRRMSIDPDAPAPSPRRAARRPAAGTPQSEIPQATPDRAPADVVPAPSDAPPTAPDDVAAPAPDPGTPITAPAGDRPSTRKATPTTSKDKPAKADPAKETPARPRAGSAAARGARRRGAGTEQGWATALDDPAIDVDGNGYRSFYVNDAVFARFRAAVYWTARRPDATGVPDNMSAGIEAYMDEVAADLERRYNDGAVFRPTPDQLRAHRKRQS